MEYYAEIDDKNLVVRIICVDDKYNDETEGNSYLQSFLGGTWKRTKKDGSIKGNRARVGYTYFADQDLFMPPKPYTSWNMVTADATWTAPITMPTLTEEEISAGKYYSWDEDAYQADNTQGWTLNTPE